MPFRKLEQLPNAGKILCLDVGKKTLGIAICDALRTIATAYPTIRRTKWKNDKQVIAKYIEQNRIECFVVGWPVNADGTKSSSTDAAESFADTLENEFGLPVMLFDETYSTKMAEEVMLSSGMNRKKAKEKNLDSVAASFILQNLLDSL
jgi:putative Holliday junction resolvase|tara:strand:+ start:31 stop:477 length:447 start_codon:yes stop_codon:yes gene_type:complete